MKTTMIISTLFVAVTCFVLTGQSMVSVGAVSSKRGSDQSPQDGRPLSSTDTLTATVYLPLVSKPRPPLFVGMTLRWDASGFGRGSEAWDAGWHLTRNLDAMTDADTIRSNNYGWYSPNPFNWPSESWYSYYSVSTLEFKASSAIPDPDWKWVGAPWILPYSVSPSNGATVVLNGQPFLVSGPFTGYTAFGEAVQYWQFANRDTFLYWDGGGDWTQYAHAGEIIHRYDAGSTRLLIYSNELRRWYYLGGLTSDTIQWIENLTSTNAWPTAYATRQDRDQSFGDTEVQRGTMRPYRMNREITVAR